jgi:hypothetical protein
MGQDTQPDALTEALREVEPPVRLSASCSDFRGSGRPSARDGAAADLPLHSGPVSSTENSLSGRLLVFDCHEAWVYQLRLLGLPMDIVVGLRGRHKSGWDEAMRPLPPRARLIRPEEISQDADVYYCIITHNLTDLLDVKSLAGPRLLVLHETLDGAILEQRATVRAGEMRRAVGQFTQMTNTHVVAVSKMKGESWGLSGDVVRSCAALEDYPAWQGDIARGLRVSNHILKRPKILLWEFHRQAFGGLPVTVVGHNPEMDGVSPAADWANLKDILSHHRFYIHTADPRLEDGFNMATFEAMAAGLPVLGNCHPTSPVVNGVNGFLSDDPAELRGRALDLLEDRELAARMGAAARDTVARQFSPSRFAEGFRRSIAVARSKWNRRRIA